MGLQIKRDQLRNLVTKWVGESNEKEESDEYVNHSAGLGIGAKPAKIQKASATYSVERVLKRKLGNQAEQESQTYAIKSGEEEEESKFSLKKTKIQNIGGNFIESLQSSDSSAQKKKKKKKKKKGSQAMDAAAILPTNDTNIENSKDTVTQINTEPAVIPTEKNVTNEVNQAKKEPKDGDKFTNSGYTTKRTVKVKYVQSKNGELKRKTKTRSKQKNIRKDTRKQKLSQNQEATNNKVEEASSNASKNTTSELSFEESDFASNWNE